MDRNDTFAVYFSLPGSGDVTLVGKSHPPRVCVIISIIIHVAPWPRNKEEPLLLFNKSLMKDLFAVLK